MTTTMDANTSDVPLSDRKLLLRALRAGDVSAFFALVDHCQERGTEDDLRFVAKYHEFVRFKREIEPRFEVYSFYSIGFIRSLLDLVSVFHRQSERDRQRDLAMKIYHALPSE